MTINNINLETIIKMLEVVPKSKEYTTRNIEIARGKWKYKPSALKQIKNLFKCQK